MVYSGIGHSEHLAVTEDIGSTVNVDASLPTAVVYVHVVYPRVGACVLPERARYRLHTETPVSAAIYKFKPAASRRVARSLHRARLIRFYGMDFWSTPPRWTDDPNRPLVGSAALQEFIEDEGALEDAEEVWFTQKAYEAEWAIESGGDIYFELNVPYAWFLYNSDAGHDKRGVYLGWTCNMKNTKNASPCCRSIQRFM